MPDRALQEKVSAYADGELDPIEIRQIEAALASQPELRAFLDRTRALDRRGLKAIKKITPKLDETAAQAAWKSIEARLGAPAEQLGGASDQAGFWNEKAAALNEVPPVDDKKWDAVWSKVQDRTASVKPERQQEPARVKKITDPAPNVVQGNFNRTHSPARRWTYWMASVSLAAAVMLMVGMVWLKNISHPPPVDKPEPVAMAAEVFDNNKYFMLVKTVPGIETPVVCFYLKEQEPEKDLFE